MRIFYRHFIMTVVLVRYVIKFKLDMLVFIYLLFHDLIVGYNMALRENLVILYVW